MADSKFRRQESLRMTKYPGTPAYLVKSFLSNRTLIVALTKREILGRYRGSLFGLAWSFFNPLLMLGIYTFFFSYVLKARWGESSISTHSGFAIILFVGLLVHGLFSECIMRAPTLISGNVNFVKKVVFPLEIFPWVTVFSALFHMGISILVLLMMISLDGQIHASVLWLPLVVLPLVLVTIGSTWFLAAIGVFVKDIGQIMSVFSTILLFLSPIFYPLSSLPERFRGLALINPLTLIVEQARTVAIYGMHPDWAGLCIYLICSLLFAWAGFFWFQKVRKGFADVL